MEEQLNRIEGKIDRIDKRLNKIDITQVEQHLTLQDHTRRSTMLEEIVLPMQKKLTLFEGGMKILGVLVTVAGVVAGVIDVLLRLIHH